MPPSSRSNNSLSRTPSSDAHWLDEGEQLAWQAFSRVLLGLPAALDAQLRRDSGITHFEYLVLARLSIAPGATRRMSELAIVTGGSFSRLSHVVNRLEARGWIERAAAPQDGRGVLATLTADGQAVLIDAAPGHVQAVQSLVFESLDALQQAELRKICEAIVRRLLDANICIS
jgi:DNA-binding MarR family transcriptional regulator